MTFDLDNKSGSLIDEKEQEFWNELKLINEDNLQIFKNIVESGDQEAVEKAIKNLYSGDNAYWNN